MSRRSGFTLVELLVAIAIFALMSGFAYRGLNAMLESREALQQESRKWRDISLFVGRVERDVAAVLARRAVSAAGTPLAPVSSMIDPSSGASGLSVTRSGATLQENVLAAPQRIAYRLREGAIERMTWGSVDAAPRDAGLALPVLKSVAALDFRFLDARSGEWRSTWGLAAETALPAAVEMTLTLASGEKIVRLMDLPRAP